MNVDDVYEQHVRGLPLADRLRLAERIVAQAAAEAQGSGHAARASEGGESLGSRLRAIRARIERSGEPLLDEAGVRKELAARRGGAAALEPELELEGDAHLR